jgi:hypothetical protein
VPSTSKTANGSLTDASLSIGLFYATDSAQPRSSFGSTDLPQRAVEAFTIHRKRQLEEPHKVSANWQDYGLVFASSKGTPSTPRT